MRALSGLILGAAALAAIWWMAALWQFSHPQLMPNIWVDTIPMLGAALLGVVALLAGLAVLIRSGRRRTSFVSIALGLLAIAGPGWVVADTAATFNDWNFANRTFLAAYLPAVALALDASLIHVDHLPHLTVHHAHPLPGWEVAALERAWARLASMTGGEAPEGIVLYLNDAGAGALGIGRHGAAYGPLVIARPLTAVDACQGGVLHELAHAFLYVQSKGNTFPQLLDEGWAVANQGCPRRELDLRVLSDLQSGHMPPLEYRLTGSAFRAARYGGADTGYDAGGSWVAWLLARYGPRRFVALIDTATAATIETKVQAIYGVPFSRLKRSWLAHIAHEFGLSSLSFEPEKG